MLCYRLPCCIYMLQHLGKEKIKKKKTLISPITSMKLTTIMNLQIRSSTAPHRNAPPCQPALSLVTALQTAGYGRPSLQARSGDQRFPYPWTYYEACGWQAICNRRRREVSCHLLTIDTIHRFILRRDINLGDTKEKKNT